MFKVIFSDGHSLPVKAATREAARIIALRIEKVFSVVDVVPA